MNVENHAGLPGREFAAKIFARALIAGICVAASLPTTALAAFPGTNGRIAVETDKDGDTEIVTMVPDGSDVTALTANTVRDQQPAWSPDGSKIAFASNRSGRFEIWIMNMNGTGLRKLLTSPSFDLYPAWSSDGIKIAFARNDSETGVADIWIANAADGSVLTRLTATDDATELQPAWSLDGSKIAFVTDRDGDREIYVMGADGSLPTNLSNDPFFEDESPDWSPDGTSIVFGSDRVANVFRLFTMAANGSSQQEVPGTDWDDQQPAFSPDGKEIVFAGYRDGSLAVYRLTLGDPDSRTLLSGVDSDGFTEQRPDWQPVVETDENQPPVANAGPDGTANCTSPQGGSVTLDGSHSSDPDSTAGTHDDIKSFEWFLGFDTPSQSLIATGEVAEVALPFGEHVVTLRVTDSAGATATDEAVWTVGDTAPPTISVSLDPSVLWPPNHQMVPVHATVTAADVCGAPLVVLAAVTSSELDDAPGGGDGNTVHDIQGATIGAADFDLLLRAERSGSGPGRVYTVVYTARDAAGNSASASATVVVPHDLSQDDAGGKGNSLVKRRSPLAKL